jgi:hypothetical protein
VIRYGDVQCYAPLSHLGDPAPKSAREVLRRGERREFVLVALDPQRRGIELGLPDVASVSGRPTDETVAAEVGIVRRRRRSSTPDPIAEPQATNRSSGRTRQGAIAAAPSESKPATKARRGADHPPEPSAATPSSEPATAEDGGPRRRRGARSGVTGVLRRRGKLDTP